jgi:hypothetical protein
MGDLKGKPWAYHRFDMEKMYTSINRVLKDERMLTYARSTMEILDGVLAWVRKSRILGVL